MGRAAVGPRFEPWRGHNNWQSLCTHTHAHKHMPAHTHAPSHTCMADAPSCSETNSQVCFALKFPPRLPVESSVHPSPQSPPISPPGPTSGLQHPCRFQLRAWQTPTPVLLGSSFCSCSRPETCWVCLCCLVRVLDAKGTSRVDGKGAHKSKLSAADS